ncbi:MAG TPA: hypothetical protein VGX27_12020 [Candidatus Dormibacteraeota bacterium]|nr:hypothetical protein [Candidatus Dormibacteraeota bacterium]
MIGHLLRWTAAIVRKSPITIGLVGFCVVVLSASVLGADTRLLGSSSSKGAPDPEAGLSDSQRQAMHDAAHARNSRYLKEFVAAGRDPHSLPIVRVETYEAAPPNLGAALAAADAVVIGRVLNVTFADNPSGGMPIATATVEVTRKIRGTVGSTITIQQLGGPVATESGGALAEFDTDQLLLPGDEAILMLKLKGGVFHPVPAAGVNLVRNGRVLAEASNPFRLLFTGHSVDEVAAYLT